MFIFTVENNEQKSEVEVIVEVDSMVDRSTPFNNKNTLKSNNNKDSKKAGKWILQKSGRFAHSEEYLRELISSFSNLNIISLTKIIPR